MLIFRIIMCIHLLGHPVCSEMLQFEIIVKRPVSCQSSSGPHAEVPGSLGFREPNTGGP
jgi:hypothetical protein